MASYLGREASWGAERSSENRTTTAHRPTLPFLPHMQTQTLPSMGALGLPHKSHSLTGTACFPQLGFCSLLFGDCFSGPGTCCLCPDSRTEKQHLGLGAGLWAAESLTGLCQSLPPPPHKWAEILGSTTTQRSCSFKCRLT